jgi:hypothetical protein
VETALDLFETSEQAPFRRVIKAHAKAQTTLEVRWGSAARSHWWYVAMLFWALLASGQINMRKVDGWQTLATAPIDQPIDLAP